MQKNIRINVSGIVQGVSFRWWAQRLAKQLNLKGFVKNLYDGRVIIEVEGDQKDIDIFVCGCRNGPERARVDNIEISEGTIKSYKYFDIKH